MEKQIKEAFDKQLEKHQFMTSVDIGSIVERKKKKGRRVSLSFAAAVPVMASIFFLVTFGSLMSDDNLPTDMTMEKAPMTESTPMTESVPSNEVQIVGEDTGNGDMSTMTITTPTLPADVFLWEGKKYTHTSTTIEEDKLNGEIGKIKNSAPEEKLTHGYSTVLPRGAKVYKIKDSSNLAVFIMDQYVIYEVQD